MKYNATSGTLNNRVFVVIGPINNTYCFFFPFCFFCALLGKNKKKIYFSATKFGDSYKEDIMNLSDLVHRTAGDNKVLTTTSKTSCNSRGNNNLFQQGPSTTNNGIEPSSFLFSMPNVTPVCSFNV